MSRPAPTSQHAAVVTLMSGAAPPRRPTIQHVAGTEVLAYSVPRFTLSRRLIEKLPSDGILLQRIDSSKGKGCWVAMTRREFEGAFPDIDQTDSWEFGYYTCAGIPVPARRFVVV